MRTFDEYTRVLASIPSYLRKREAGNRRRVTSLTSELPRVREYFTDWRAPWIPDDVALRNRFGETEKTCLRIHTICVNTAVLLVLRRICETYGVRLELHEGFVTPVEYWNAPDFLDKCDLFFTELSAPLRSDFLADEKVRLLSPIHRVRQGALALRPFVLEERGARGIAVSATSSETDAARRLKRTSLHLVPTTDHLRHLLPVLATNEAVFVWDPWLEWIQDRHQRLIVESSDLAAMGFFMTPRVYADKARFQAALVLLAGFITEWNALGERGTALTVHDLRSLLTPPWRNAQHRALSLVTSGTEGEEPLLTATRADVITRLEHIFRTLQPDVRNYQVFLGERSRLKRRVESMEDTRLLMHLRESIDRIVGAPNLTNVQRVEAISQLLPPKFRMTR